MLEYIPCPAAEPSQPRHWLVVHRTGLRGPVGRDTAQDPGELLDSVEGGGAHEHLAACTGVAHHCASKELIRVLWEGLAYQCVGAGEDLGRRGEPVTAWWELRNRSVGSPS